MARNKLFKFDALKTHPPVFESPFLHERSWQDVFENDHPLILELGAGKAYFSVSYAMNHPKQNIIAYERKGDRLWKGADKAMQEKLNNIRFIRSSAHDLLEYFPKHSVSEIWITFPDPYPKDRHAKHRLTSPRYLDLYKDVLTSDGQLHLKTDAVHLYEYTKEVLASQGYNVIEDIQDIYENPISSEDIRIQTDYEKKHLVSGKTIYYLKAKLQ